MVLPGPDEVLEFWFGRPDEPGWGELRDFWFRAGPEVDREVVLRFGPLYEAAQAGALDGWQATPESSIALVIVLDQFSRHLHRGSAAAFAADARALAVADHAIASGFDRALAPVKRHFLYLPFMHSERLDDQRRCVRLMAALEGEGYRGGALKAAREHFELIERFGRFPHRNAALGRVSTPDEERFLREGGRSFGQERNQNQNRSRS